MKRKLLCLALAFIISVFAFGTFAYADSDTFIYEHDPRDNPEAMKDIIEDPDAVYGFSPDPESERLGSYAEYDWSDPELVEPARICTTWKRLQRITLTGM